MARAKTQSQDRTIARNYLRTLVDRDVAARYSQAVFALADVSVLSKHFEATADAAIHHSEMARLFRSKAIIEITASRKAWNSLSGAALKLNKEFERNDFYTHVRIAHALKAAGLNLTPTQYKTLPRFLLNLSQQKADGFRTEYIVGPLRIASPGRKRLSLSSALTICLAYTFHSIANDRLRFIVGATIKKGMAWDVAADFAQAALKSDEDANPAKKALSEYRGQLVFNGWRRVTVGKQK